MKFYYDFFKIEIFMIYLHEKRKFKIIDMSIYIIHHTY